MRARERGQATRIGSSTRIGPVAVAGRWVRYVKLTTWAWGVAIALLGAPPVWAQRPNVVLIIADDMNSYSFDDSGIRAKTPNLDRLREEAMTFTRAYCSSPVCAPSRAALFSGMLPHRTGFYFNGADAWNESKSLQKAETLMEIMRRSGYKTWGGGKLTHAKMPADRHDFQWENDPKTYGGWGPYLDGDDRMGSKTFGVKAYDGPDEDFPDVRCLIDVREYLRETHNRPFFIVVGMWRPHAPWNAPTRFFDLYDPDQLPIPMPGVEQDLSDVPVYGQRLARIFGDRWDKYGASDEDAWRKLLHGYLASTSFADWTIGQLIDAVESSQYGENTLFVVTSDNGLHLGEKAHFGHATLWDQSTRVPLIVKTPTGLGAGQQCRKPVSLLDIYPTLIELCPLETPPQRLHGASLSSLLENPKDEDWDVPSITTYGAKMVAMRRENWSFILYRDGGRELYRLDRDPQETNNLADDPSGEQVLKYFNKNRPKRWVRSLGGKKG